MKISFITTCDHNVGDDFVREGLKYLLRQHYRNLTLDFENIHKHAPITSRHGFERFRDHRYARLLDLILPLGVTGDRILEADLVVQSGAPVYWCHENSRSHCAENEWFGPLIRRRYRKRRGGAPLINIAAGSCQRYASDGFEFTGCGVCPSYIKEFFALCALTTVRDSLAQKVLGGFGLDAPLIPCSSIFAVDAFGLKSEGEDYVVVNYMKNGAHYTFGQDIDADHWHDQFKKAYLEIKRHERVVFSCHSETEVREAKEIDPSAEIFYAANDYLQYMRFYANAKFGIMNRVHGAFLLGSLGKPSVVIGTDTRATMAGQIGLPSIFVNEAHADLLMAHYEGMTNGADNFRERFAAIKCQAYRDYQNVFSVL